MYIHKSHSKKELLNIINIFDIPISNPTKYRKIELSALIVNELEFIDHVNPYDKLCIYNKIDLIEYLENIHPNKKISVKERNEIIIICKKIKQYCRNHYDIRLCDYFNSKDELYKYLRYICRYGDIPSVRKVYKMIAYDTDKPKDIKLNISPIVQKDIDMKDKLRKTNFYKMEVKYGKFIVEF